MRNFSDIFISTTQYFIIRNATISYFFFARNSTGKMRKFGGVYRTPVLLMLQNNRQFSSEVKIDFVAFPRFTELFFDGHTASILTVMSRRYISAQFFFIL